MKNNKHHRHCPECSREIIYTNIKNRNQAEKKRKICRECTNKRFVEINRKKTIDKYLKFDDDRNKQIMNLFEKNGGANWRVLRMEIYPLFLQFKKETKPKAYYRYCPKCGDEISYSAKFDMNSAEAKGGLCQSCCKLGKNNPFYGKKHSKKSMNKRLKTLETSDKWQKSVEHKRTPEYKKKISEKMSGENNGRFGLGSLKDIWTMKYGKKEAERRNIEWKEKQRKNSSGKDNPMYGKPSPQGSGNGWSGWYNGWFFRSLGELSYMINVIEKNNIKWESAEKSKWGIKYKDYKGTDRTYFADFILLENNKMIECKPQKLIDGSPLVMAKKKAAKKFCKKHNLQYELVDAIKLLPNEIKELYLSKKIKFIDRYEKRFIERYL